MAIGVQVVHEPDLREALQEFQEERVEGEPLVRVLVARGQHPDVVHGIAGVGGGQFQQDSTALDVVEIHKHAP